ncbi:MAG: hypothetical protein WD674_01390 [Cucumibacter sp.]
MHAVILRLNRRNLLAGSAALAAAAALRPLRAVAQESYLSGQTLEFNSGSSEGSPGNQLMQELASAFGRVLPETQVVFRANPGGTSALSAAIVAEADPDGLTIGSIDTDSLLAKAIGSDVYDVSDFALLGALDQESDMLFASTASGITDVGDVIGRDEPAILPVRSVTSGGYFQALLINSLLGTRILPVTGYDSGARHLAFVSGEAQLGFFGLSGAGQVLADGTGRLILKIADLPLSEGPGEAPTLASFDANPEFLWIVDFLRTTGISHIVGAPKSTPPDRLEVLRLAFNAAVADPQFVEEAAKLIVLEPIPGAEIEVALVGILARIESLAESLTRALECGMQIAITGEACAP